MAKFKNPWEPGGAFDTSKEVLGSMFEKLTDGQAAWTAGQNEWENAGNEVINGTQQQQSPTLHLEPVEPDWDNVFINDRKDIVILLDPGHMSNTCGSNLKPEVRRKIYGETGGDKIISYTHYKRLEKADGTPITDPNGDFQIEMEGTGDEQKPKIVITTVEDMDLPENKYLRDDLGKAKREWITKANESGNSKNFERTIMYNLSIELENLLSKYYTVYRTKTESADQCIKLAERTSKAKSVNAHYFIALHADGDPGYDYRANGSHAVYHPISPDVKGYNNRQQEFATDVMSHYTAVSFESIFRPNGVGNDLTRTLYVLSNTSNPAPRKVLIEFGFLSNPNDFNVMTTQQAQIARQIAEGLEANIRKHYFNPGQPKKWAYKGKEYTDKDKIPYPSRKEWERKNSFLPSVLWPPYHPEPQEQLDTRTIYEKVELPVITF